MKKTIIYSFVLFLYIFVSNCNTETAQPVSSDLRKEITRKWYCELNDGQNTYNFESVISLDPNNKKQIFISNFNNLDAKAKAIVYEDRRIELPSQNIPGTSTNVAGDADINSDFTRINWSYKVTDTEGVYSVTVVYTLSDISK